MSGNPLKVSTITGVVFSTDDVHLSVDASLCRPSNDGALRWSSFQEERLGASGLSKIKLSIAAWLCWYGG